MNFFLKNKSRNNKTTTTTTFYSKVYLTPNNSTFLFGFVFIFGVGVRRGQGGAHVWQHELIMKEREFLVQLFSSFTARSMRITLIMIIMKSYSLQAVPLYGFLTLGKLFSFSLFLFFPL